MEHYTLLQWQSNSYQFQLLELASKIKIVTKVIYIVHYTSYYITAHMYMKEGQKDIDNTLGRWMHNLHFGCVNPNIKIKRLQALVSHLIYRIPLFWHLSPPLQLPSPLPLCWPLTHKGRGRQRWRRREGEEGTKDWELWACPGEREGEEVHGGNRGSKGGHGGYRGLGVGRNLRVRKPEQELGRKTQSNGGKGGSEGAQDSL